MRRVFGVGINDADYVVQPTVNGKQVPCPFYLRWKSVLERCYSKNYQRRQPTYIGCETCEEWHSFMAFRSWMIDQPWRGNHLDKDFLGGRFYSPDTCLFIPQWLNNLFTDSGRVRGKYPIGVSKCRGIFQMCLCADTRIQKYFPTSEQAHSAYLEAKTNHVRSLYPEIAAIDPRLVPACERKLRELHTCP